MLEKPFPAYQGVEPFLFASYAHADDGVVYPEILRLHEAGYRVWYDEGINPAEEWPRSISQALITSKLVVAFLSARALASKWVQREIALAVRREKELLPVYLEPVELADDLELQIGSVQAIFRHNLTPEAYWQQLTRRLDGVPDLNRRPKEDADQWLRRNLAAAVQLQRGLLPQKLPSAPGYSFWATMRPFADTAGGELYDFHALPTGEVLTLVSVVAGRGFPAALGMAALTGMITLAVETFGPDLPAMVSALNRAFCRRLGPADRFASLIALALNPETHRVRAVNAAHGQAVVRRRDGSIEVLEQSGLPLGAVEELSYETTSIDLAPGDAVFIGSNGIVEYSSSQARMYGTERLHKALTAAKGDASEVGEAILADLKEFSGGRGSRSDFSAICLVRDPS